jgi:hypothetical protein
MKMGNIHPLQSFVVFPRYDIACHVNESARIDRMKQGRCPGCGIRTHEKHGLFFLSSHYLVPLTSDHVINGRCISCADDEVPPEEA